MPDLWLVALFCPITKNFHTPPYCLSGAWMGSNHEKNSGWKYRDTLSLMSTIIVLYCTLVLLKSGTFICGDFSSGFLVADFFFWKTHTQKFLSLSVLNTVHICFLETTHTRANWRTKGITLTLGYNQILKDLAWPQAPPAIS